MIQINKFILRLIMIKQVTIGSYNKELTNKLWFFVKQTLYFYLIKYYKSIIYSFFFLN